MSQPTTSRGHATGRVLFIIVALMVIAGLLGGALGAMSAGSL